METPQTPNSPAPAPDSGKKPMPTAAKVGIGCGALLLVGVIVIALLVGWCNRTVGDFVRDLSENPERVMAESFVKLNPELDLVKTDDDDKTITFRDKSGKETTMSWSDVAEGKLSFSDSEGNEITFGGANMESVPEWVPRLPETTQIVSSHHAVEGGKLTGAYMVGTNMATSEIVAFLGKQAEALGMEQAVDSRQDNAGQVFQMLGFKSDSRGFSATIVRDNENEAKVQFIYEEEP